ncbi:MAG: hypothetical protein AAFR26_26345 [Cyanobacteria bacterium J06626_4]
MGMIAPSISMPPVLATTLPQDLEQGGNLPDQNFLMFAHLDIAGRSLMRPSQMAEITI